MDPDPGPAYRQELAAARARTGVDESVLTGEGLIRGRRVAVIVSEFRFLAGSIGQAAAERIVTAVERATREGLPLLAGPASGGTRMQEGTVAFLSMVKISAAVRTHRKAGLPYLVYLRHPTTGGVMASWGSLGHITVAEPGALLGFLGPRVYEALHANPFPENVQMAENLFDKGLIDAVVPPWQLSDVVDRALGHPGHRPPPAGRRARDSVREAVRRRRLDSIGISRTPAGPTSASCWPTGPGTCFRSTAPARAKRTPACSWPWPVSARNPALCSAIRGPRPVAADGDGARRPSVRPGAACGWPRSSGCRW